MCDIGKPIEIIDVEPLSLPTPLRREKEQPTQQPATVEAFVSAETPVERDRRRGEALTWRGEPFAAVVVHAPCPTPITVWTWARCRTPTFRLNRSRLTGHGTGLPRASLP